MQTDEEKKSKLKKMVATKQLRLAWRRKKKKSKT